VDVHPVRHRPQEADLVHLLGQLRQMLADLNAGDVRSGGLELAANLRRRIGLHVPQIDLAGTAEEEQEDARPGPLRRGRLLGTKRLELAGRESEQAQAADAQQFAAAKGPARPFVVYEYGEHHRAPPRGKNYFSSCSAGFTPRL
jgi:hypothetical protein